MRGFGFPIKPRVELLVAFSTSTDRHTVHTHYTQNNFRHMECIMAYQYAFMPAGMIDVSIDSLGVKPFIE